MDDREEDILDRGGDFLVHDFDGKIVSLRDAATWYNNIGTYVKPRGYVSSCDNIMLVIKMLLGC